MGGRRPYWNMDVETKLNTPEMKEIQWEKIKKRIADFYSRTTFWRSYWDKASARPGGIRTWDDFEKQIPVLTKDDYRLFAVECGGD